MQACLETAHSISRDLPGAIWLRGTALVAATSCLLGYTRYALRRANPIVDLRLFGQRTFRIATLAGGLCRVSLGATPFLLPQFLQLGCGLSPLGSGSLTCVVAAGAIGLKASVTSISRKFGLRNVLVVNAVVLGAMTMAISVLSRAMPYTGVATVLFAYGFLRSLQFTSMNALAYAELPPAMQSQGTTIGGIAQQLFPSFGVAIASAALSLLCADQGVLRPQDFSVVFVVLGLFPLMSAAWFRRLSADDGAGVSRHERATSSSS